MNTKLKRVDQCLFLAYIEERKVALDRPRDMVPGTTHEHGIERIRRDELGNETGLQKVQETVF